MFDTRKLQGENHELKITFMDGMYILGTIISVDDEEDSELGEPGITILTPEGRFVGLGDSEIKLVEPIE